MAFATSPFHLFPSLAKPFSAKSNLFKAIPVLSVAPSSEPVRPPSDNQMQHINPFPNPPNPVSIFLTQTK